MAGLVGRMESIFEDSLVSIRVNEQSFANYIAHIFVFQLQDFHFAVHVLVSQNVD